MRREEVWLGAGLGAGRWTGTIGAGGIGWERGEGEGEECLV